MEYTLYPENCPRCGAQTRRYDLRNDGDRYENGDVAQVLYRRYACGGEYWHYRMLHADLEWGHEERPCGAASVAGVVD